MQTLSAGAMPVVSAHDRRQMASVNDRRHLTSLYPRNFARSNMLRKPTKPCFVSCTRLWFRTVVYRCSDGNSPSDYHHLVHNAPSCHPYLGSLRGLAACLCFSACCHRMQPLASCRQQRSQPLLCSTVKAPRRPSSLRQLQRLLHILKNQTALALVACEAQGSGLASPTGYLFGLHIGIGLTCAAQCGSYAGISGTCQTYRSKRCKRTCQASKRSYC